MFNYVAVCYAIYFFYFYFRIYKGYWIKQFRNIKNDFISSITWLYIAKATLQLHRWPIRPIGLHLWFVLNIISFIIFLHTFFVFKNSMHAYKLENFVQCICFNNNKSYNFKMELVFKNSLEWTMQLDRMVDGQTGPNQYLLLSVQPGSNIYFKSFNSKSSIFILKLIHN